jgi:hypothetical protein
MNAEDQDLTDVYELLEEMTPPEVRLARQLLGQMHQLWEGIVSQEARLLHLEDLLAVTETISNGGLPAKAIENVLAAIEQRLGERLRPLDERLRVLNHKIESVDAAVLEIEGCLDLSPSHEPLEESRLEAKKAKPKARGLYCRNCGRTLSGRQKVFCTRKCAAVWHGQHQGEVATPRLEINEKPEAVVEAGVGVVKGSVSDNGKRTEEVAAV